VSDRIHIRRAEPGDAGVLSRIAFAAKGHWGYPERWMEHWRDVLTITPEFISQNEVHAATVQGELAGFYALDGEGPRMELEHLWVLPERMGLGLGRALFEHALDRAAELGTEILAIEADPNAEGFYRRMGATCVGEIVYELDGRERVLPLLAADVQHHRSS
jgi:GNAT superfamily N-acetyltransferase